MKKFFKVYNAPGYPIDPQAEQERAYQDLQKFKPERPLFFMLNAIRFPMPKGEWYRELNLNLLEHSQN